MHFISIINLIILIYNYNKENNIIIQILNI